MGTVELAWPPHDLRARQIRYYYNSFGQPLDRAGKPGPESLTHHSLCDGGVFPGLWWFGR